jgi:hypothetical protein
MGDVGKSKAVVAAERINARVAGVKVTPHHCRIEEKPAEWYQQFTIIILGLDSLEARRYMNTVICSFLGESCARGNLSCLSNRCNLWQSFQMWRAPMAAWPVENLAHSGVGFVPW